MWTSESDGRATVWVDGIWWIDPGYALDDPMNQPDDDEYLPAYVPGIGWID